MFFPCSTTIVVISAVLVTCFRCAIAMPSPLPCPSTTDCECRTTSGNDVMARCKRADTLTGFPVLTSSNDGQHRVIYSSLSLVKAELTSLPEGGFRYAQSRALDLTGNPLDRQTGVPDDAFDGLETVLNVLIFTECGLVRVPSAVGRLFQLHTLQLDGNKIQMLKRSSFKRNSRLLHLSLRRNGLQRLDSGAFDGLSQLRELRLSDNQLTTIPPASFSSLLRLTRLDLSDNFVHQLHPGTFTGLSRLVWLELEANSIHVLDKTTFAGLAGLQSLDLDRNPMRSIDNGSFSELKRLRYLSLNVAGNVSIGQFAFRGLGSLVNLAFGEVGRGALPAGLFTPLRSLSYLSICGRQVEPVHHNIHEPMTDISNERSSSSSTPDDSGLRPDHFRSDMNFTKLYVWIDAIHQCRCSVDWIRRLVDRGTTVHGSCGATHQLIQCTKYQLPRGTGEDLLAQSQPQQQQQEYIQGFIDDYHWY